jgi:hypothetical protein
MISIEKKATRVGVITIDYSLTQSRRTAGTAEKYGKLNWNVPKITQRVPKEQPLTKARGR